MTPSTIKRYLAAAGVAAGLTVSMSQGVRGQAAAQTPPAAPAQTQQTPQMMAERQKMMAQMQAENKKLDELVAQMNSATGTAKIDRIAAVLTELVAQHKRMGGMMMQGNMMPMMQNGGRGNAVPAQPSGAKPEADHSQHH